MFGREQRERAALAPLAPSRPLVLYTARNAKCPPTVVVDMPDLLTLLLFVGVYLALQLWILPKLGVRT